MSFYMVIGNCSALSDYTLIPIKIIQEGHINGVRIKRESCDQPPSNDSVNIHETEENIENDFRKQFFFSPFFVFLMKFTKLK